MKKIINKLRDMKNAVRNFFVINSSQMLRMLHEPDIPVNADGKVLIHIGCGEADDPRYINFDTRPLKHVHYVDTLDRFDQYFPLDCADLIYACHVIEHVSYLKLLELFKVFYSRLKKGGILRISVPDFEAMIEIYRQTQDIENIFTPLMGGQRYEDNFHRSAFDKKYLTQLFKEAGFQTVREWNSDTAEYHSFDDWSIRNIPKAGREWPINLNLEGIK